ncbi:MAG: aspartate aminotransferase family protein [Chloroflexi bacterium]|nr:aspartate aminotransferase family protein [Chloroflexota bacterium]
MPPTPARQRSKPGSNHSEAVRLDAIEYLWMHNRGWAELAEQGGPLVATEGRGVRIRDSQGQWWLDANAGYVCVNIGYGRTEVADAAYRQMKQLSYFPGGSTTEPVVALARKLAEITPGDLSRTFFTSGGSESNETAVKIARAFHKRVGENGRYKIISREGSFHGALGLSMWLGGMTGRPRNDYEPPPPGMIYAPQPNPYRYEKHGRTAEEAALRCADAIEDLIKFHGPDTVAAFIAEPIAVPPGVAVPADGYWPRVREICNRYGVLLIADEVITGFGRTGKMFACEHWGFVPDVMSVAKGIVSAYLPLGATIARKEIADAFAGVGKNRYFQHILTYSGHPVPAAAALKNIEILQTEKLIENSAAMGRYFLDRLQELKERHKVIGDVRGLGLLLGIELVQDRSTKEPFPADAKIGERLTAEFEKRRIVLRPGSERFWVGPPLCVTRDEVDEIVDGLDGAIGAVASHLTGAKRR